jgi:hypothetical protein
MLSPPRRKSQDADTARNQCSAAASLRQSAVATKSSCRITRAAVAEADR